MLYKLIAAGLVLSNVAAAPTPVEEAAAPAEHGRELFPLTTVGAKAGAKAAARSAHRANGPMMNDALKGPMKALERLALSDAGDNVISSDTACTRRHAMARAAGLAAGLALSTVNAPAFAAETKSIKMGSDSGQLVFVPDEVKACAGDSITWTNNKGGPHNVVFDEDEIPAGVDAEKISMDDQLGDTGATYTVKLEKAGKYSYFCEPHRGAGMVAVIVVG